LLSKKRCEVVANYLVSKGISKNRIKINYFGETIPISENTTAEGRQKNRRVELKIIVE
jgi:outer membrane protein OmpA-like peptidoglycan-associated protein